MVCTQASRDSARAETDASAAEACVKRCEGVEGSGAATRLKACQERLAAIRMAEVERKHRRASPIELDYVTIRGGIFKMGSETGDPDETPVHDARVETFELMKTEVSVAQYVACVKAKECTARTTVKFASYSVEEATFWSVTCNSGRADRVDHPINCVDATDADAFCRWAGGARLPTETEWEYAARGNEGRLYPWGPQPPDATRVNACGAECVEWAARNGRQLPQLHNGHDGWSTTAPVSSFKDGATPQRVLQLSGNVWEWTASRYCDYPGKNCDDSARVFRGGSWNNTQVAWFRSANRSRYRLTNRLENLGFRCAR